MNELVDLEVLLPDRPGALADLGEALGAAGVSLEGGGVFTHDGVGVAHFLVADGGAALRAVRTAGLGDAVVHDVVTLRLHQDVPGQLGSAARLLADAGANIEVQYSDHAGNLVLVVAPETQTAAREVASRWSARPGR